MKEIPLTQGKVALIDDEDYPRIASCTWHAKLSGKVWYAKTGLGPEGQRAVEMQKVLMGDDPMGRQIDHINGNGLDNRRANLRWATKSQQGQNSSASRANRSGFKGVYLKTAGRWAATIKKDRKTIHIGYFDTPQEAARAYDARAVELFGEFARPNFASQ